MTIPRPDKEEVRIVLFSRLRALYKNLLEAGKGRASLSEAEWFYALFLPKQAHGAPPTIEGIRACLRHAVWVDENDIKQCLRIAIWRKQLYLAEHPDAVICLRLTLGRILRDWLVAQKVFKEKTGWRASYVLEHSDVETIDAEESATVLLLKRFQQAKSNALFFSPFEVLFLHLRRIMGLTLFQTADTLVTSRRQIDRWESKLNRKLEEYYGTAGTQSARAYGDFYVTKHGDWERGDGQGANSGSCVSL